MSFTKLKPGDEIRVIAPSQSWNKRRESSYRRSLERLEAADYKVSFSRNIRNKHRFDTATVQDRLDDLHDAYRDKSVKAVWCLSGGWSANELLGGIDWQLLKDNPKPLIGFSDITVLINAIYAKTGQVGLLGPNFSSAGKQTLYQYSLDNLLNVLQGTQREVKASRQWTDWGMKPRKTRPWQILNAGVAEGRIIGGNLGTFYLLQGTPYQPLFDQKTILLAEDDSEAGKLSARELDRRLESLLQLPGARESIVGVLIGRFQPDSRVTMPDVKDIVDRKFDQKVPVFSNIDFGHTAPQLTFPVGGTLKMYVKNKRPTVELVEY